MPRIVSLISSATEILHALELSEFQVGRSHECDYPESILHLPICTTPTFPVNGSSAEIDRLVKAKLRTAASIYEVFPEVLERLQPTHVLTQTQCKVCAVSLEDVERALAAGVSSNPKVVALEPNSLAGIWSDIRRVARECGAERRGVTLVNRLEARMAAIAIRAAATNRAPRIACVEWQEPLMAAGNWVPELVAMAGGDNQFGKAGEHSPWMTWDELAVNDPDVIAVMPCGYDLARTREEMHWLTQNPAWVGLSAVRNGQVFLVDGNQYLNRPGPRIVESLQILAEILHPKAFEPTLRGAGWEPFGSSLKTV